MAARMLARPFRRGAACLGRPLRRETGSSSRCWRELGGSSVTALPLMAGRGSGVVAVSGVSLWASARGPQPAGKEGAAAGAAASPETGSQELLYLCKRWGLAACRTRLMSWGGFFCLSRV